MKILTVLILAANVLLYSEVNVYVFESDGSGFNTKSFFYDNGSEVVAFGGQFTPQIAEKAVAFLQTKTQNPISYLIITHPNPDKFNGASVFQQQGAQVICSQSTAIAIPKVHSYKKYYFVHVAKMFTEETYPQMANVDIVFEKTLEIYLNSGERLTLEEHNKPGVSSTQTLVHFQDSKSLFVGDLIHHKAHAWLEGGIVKGKASATINAWIDSLNYIRQNFTGYTVYGGRGEYIEANAAATQQINYLQKVQQIVEEYIHNLGAKKGELQDGNAAKHHQQLERVIAQSFPQYQISYMIRFGVYGLINAILNGKS